MLSQNAHLAIARLCDPLPETNARFHHACRARDRVFDVCVVGESTLRVLRNHVFEAFIDLCAPQFYTCLHLVAERILLRCLLPMSVGQPHAVVDREGKRLCLCDRTPVALC